MGFPSIATTRYAGKATVPKLSCGNSVTTSGHASKAASAGKVERPMTSTVWQCEQMRAGQVRSKMLFQSRSEAELFLLQMQRVEPDIFWRLEAVPAQAIWN